MAKRKTAEDFQNNSFEAGYNTEPHIDDLKKPEEDIKNTEEPQEELQEEQKPLESEDDYEKAIMEDINKMVLRSSVCLSPLQREMLRLCAYKENKSYVTIYMEMFNERFPEDSDIRKEAMKKVIDDYKKGNR